MVTKTQQLQDDLLRAALSFVEHAGAKGHSLLVNLPGGAKLGIEVEILPDAEALPTGFLSSLKPARVA
ncbi:hypothetical protein OJ996_02050 [Luteolibacter sp. GHJ8]|uniref:Uncharacterized protein n=1 Tax=Luteolibacter rhizosphaerae TaxID=2989719 RepID=A0ABT3FXN3_9BACT|nr:hypothetical protein [Luteolibacter rhizosphaerae]MCW1912337.1 hypothetical protein [Luteolibacter rhizosphaerae]